MNAQKTAFCRLTCRPVVPVSTGASPDRDASVEIRPAQEHHMNETLHPFCSLLAASLPRLAPHACPDALPFLWLCPEAACYLVVQVYHVTLALPGQHQQCFSRAPHSPTLPADGPIYIHNTNKQANSTPHPCPTPPPFGPLQKPQLTTLTCASHLCSRSWQGLLHVARRVISSQLLQFHHALLHPWCAALLRRRSGRAHAGSAQPARKRRAAPTRPRSP